MLGIFAFLVIIAQIVPIEIINIIAPLVVFGATAVVKWGMPKLPGWTIVSVVVPALSLIVAWVVTMINPELSFVLHVILGLLAVFINEIIRQLGQIGK